MADVMTLVSERIIVALEQGCVPWRKPWYVPGRGAYNRITGKRYSLLNQMMLIHEGEYASFRQWTALGGKIKKGAKCEIVVFWKCPGNDEEDEEKEDNETQIKRKRPVLRYYPVFHFSQVENVEPLEKEKSVHFENEPMEIAENVLMDYIKREGIVYDDGEYAEAYFSPGRNLIHVPCIRLFKHPEEYYSTAYHEVIHSTGTEDRLCREGLIRVNFGSEIYSREELVAEIGSACILSCLGVETENSFNNSAAYIQGWLSALRNDRRMIVFAAGQAEKAVNFILNRN